MHAAVAPLAFDHAGALRRVLLHDRPGGCPSCAWRPDANTERTSEHRQGAWGTSSASVSRSTRRMRSPRWTTRLASHFTALLAANPHTAADDQGAQARYFRPFRGPRPAMSRVDGVEHVSLANLRKHGDVCAHPPPTPQARGGLDRTVDWFSPRRQACSGSGRPLGLDRLEYARFFMACDSQSFFEFPLLLLLLSAPTLQPPPMDRALPRRPTRLRPSSPHLPSPILPRRSSPGRRRPRRALPGARTQGATHAPSPLTGMTDRGPTFLPSSTDSPRSPPGTDPSGGGSRPPPAPRRPAPASNRRAPPRWTWGGRARARGPSGPSTSSRASAASLGVCQVVDASSAWSTSPPPRAPCSPPASPREGSPPRHPRGRPRRPRRRWKDARHVMVCGGFPCTNVSALGDRRGIQEGNASGLWRDMAAVAEPRTSLDVHGERAGPQVPGPAGGLAALPGRLRRGWACSPPGDGAPHKRKRMFILAKRRDAGTGARRRGCPDSADGGLVEAPRRAQRARRFVAGRRRDPDRARCALLGNAVVPSTVAAAMSWLLTGDVGSPPPPWAGAPPPPRGAPRPRPSPRRRGPAAGRSASCRCTGPWSARTSCPTRRPVASEEELLRLASLPRRVTLVGRKLIGEVVEGELHQRPDHARGEGPTRATRHAEAQRVGRRDRAHGADPKGPAHPALLRPRHLRRFEFALGNDKSGVKQRVVAPSFVEHMMGYEAGWTSPAPAKGAVEPPVPAAMYTPVYRPRKTLTGSN